MSYSPHAIVDCVETVLKKKSKPAIYYRIRWYDDDKKRVFVVGEDTWEPYSKVREPVYKGVLDSWDKRATDDGIADFDEVHAHHFQRYSEVRRIMSSGERVPLCKRGVLVAPSGGAVSGDGKKKKPGPPSRRTGNQKKGRSKSSSTSRCEKFGTRAAAIKDNGQPKKRKREQRKGRSKSSSSRCEKLGTRAAAIKGKGQPKQRKRKQRSGGKATTQQGTKSEALGDGSDSFVESVMVRYDSAVTLLSFVPSAETRDLVREACQQRHKRVIEEVMTEEELRVWWSAFVK